MRRGWIRVCKSADPLWSRAIMGWLWFIFKFADEISLWIRNTSKIFFIHANSKIRAQKMDESAIRYHWQINKSGVKISLWIRAEIFSESADPLPYSSANELLWDSWYVLTKAGQSLRTLRLYRIGAGFRGGARGARLPSFFGQTEAWRVIKTFFETPRFFRSGC